MSIHRDKWAGYNGTTWRVVCYYKDYKGIHQRHEKRGFKSKKAAQSYEREFLAKMTRNVSMSFSTFINLYLDNLRPQLKQSTMASKEFLINTHIRPYFENRNLDDINSTDILMWQNDLLSIRDNEGKGYSPTYLRTIQNQLNAMFNHAVKYYNLAINPCLATKKLGKAHSSEMKFWTKEEYLKFSNAIKDKPVSYYAFQVLYWTGIRCGELLALTRNDIDFNEQKLTINKNYQVVKGVEMITSPKTERSNRIIDIPKFLCDELCDYIDSLYKVDMDSRIFEVTKSYLHHEMDRGAKKAGVQRIRVHDLRHSACALLINLGYSPFQIAQRMGHESATITERYSHLYPTVQKEMADKLNDAFIKRSDDNE